MIELTSSGVVDLEIVRQGTHRMEVAVRSPWAFPRAPPGEVAHATPNFSKNLSFCGYGITCATLSIVIVQRRALCLCNADPCALMPVQCRSRCHDLHTLGPPHPFFQLPYQHNRVQSDARYGFGNLFVLNVSWQIVINMQNIYQTGGNQIFQDSAAKYRIPSA